MSEFEDMRDAFLQAKYGSFLILPCKYEEGGLNIAGWGSGCVRIQPETMDLTQNVKDMLDLNDTANVGEIFSLSAAAMKQHILGQLPAESSLFARDDRDYPFEVLESRVYVFHTQVAFLCLGIRYDSMYALQHILNAGYAENTTGYYALTPSGEKAGIDLNRQLEDFLAPAGLEPFYRVTSSCFLEAYTYTLAVVPRRFEKLETIRQATYNLHAMEPLEKAIEDESEQDLRYVYAKKDQERLSYGWGCCVTSQDISYIVADADMDFDADMRAQACDGLPLAALALYERFTCLRFNELLVKVDRKQPRRIEMLKRLMLEFQAYGTVPPANISRWHNVKGIYKSLLEVSEIPEAIDDIDHKLSILSEHQKELSEDRSNAVAAIITVFGTVSVLESVLSIVQMLTEGPSLEWAATGITSLVMAVMCFAAVLRKK